MTDTATLVQALAGFRDGLIADGYDLVVDGYGGGTARLRIAAGPDACAECLVPKPLMTRMLLEALRGMPEVQRIDLAYPGD